MKKTSSTKRPSEAAPGEVLVVSDDGTLRYLLRRVRAGLLVQRERQRPERQSRVTHSAVFADSQVFSKWCDSDAARFDYPIVSKAVRREGTGLLQDREAADGPRDDHQPA